MRRLVACLFLLLYCYNMAGYLAVFSARQNAIRSEMKKLIKESVPRSELILFAFHTPSLREGTYPLQWLDDHEFRYAGGMYDIVHTTVGSDTTYYLCVNDVQEERLFADLDNHVRREMGHPDKQAMLDAFKDVFKDSYIPLHDDACHLPLVVLGYPSSSENYLSVTLDVPFPPPRSDSTT